MKHKGRILILLLICLLTALVLTSVLKDTQKITPTSLPKESPSEDVPTAGPDEQTAEGIAYALRADDAYLHLIIPEEYVYQEEELSELEQYPFSYVFRHRETGDTLVVYSHLDAEKDQKHLLRKVYDPTLKHAVFENVEIGSYTYLVFTKEDEPSYYNFLMRQGDGYSYHLYYTFDAPQSAARIPEEAKAVFATLRIEPLAAE